MWPLTPCRSISIDRQIIVVVSLSSRHWPDQTHERRGGGGGGGSGGGGVVRVKAKPGGSKCDWIFSLRH